MSSAPNMSNSVASSSPTLVHYKQEFVPHLQGSHQANLMDIAQNARNFVGLQSQEAENNIQELNREGGSGWATPMQENRRPQQQQSSQPWIHYGPPTLSPIQAQPIRGFPENDDPDTKGQKRTWSDIVKSEDKDRKKMRTGFPTVDSKELENEYRKIMTIPGGFPPVGPGGEMLGYLLSSSDPNKVLSKDLQQKMNKIDGEIAMTEQTIINLKAKCNELSKVKMLSEKDDSLEAVVEVSESRPQTIARLIYSQNKLKALQSHNSLASLGTVTPLPLYNQPSDTLVYRENKKKFQTFKKLLVAHIAKRQQAEKIRIRYLSERYTQLYNQWVKKINKRENSSCRKEKDAKYREFFEKVFPDLKKQKEDKDKLQRFAVPGNRPAGYARSDAGIEEIVNELHEQEVKEKRMLSLSVTPPMMLDSRQRSLRIIDETRLIRSFDFRQKLWTTAESEIFAEKYQQFPKKFGIIASFLENKTVQDCVLFYYLTKKAANYKQMARRYQAMKKRDKKFRTAQNVQNSDNKLGENSTCSESSANVGPGFSYLSTILLPTSSFAPAVSSNPASNSTAYLSNAPVSTGSSVVERPKSAEPKNEADAAGTKKSDKAAESKKTPSSDAAEEAGTSESPPADVPSECKEASSEVEQDVQENATGQSTNDNSAEHKEAPNNAVVTEGTSSQEPPCSEPAPALTLLTTTAEVSPALDKKDPSSYSFPSMRVEDISDKEDSDSVATLSADEGPTLPPEDNKDMVQIKRPKLLIDGHKDVVDKKKYSDDLVMSWETKNSRPAIHRPLVEENTQFYAIPNSERERRSLPSSEIQDRRLDVAYHEGTDTDLMISLVRKNRSPARIKDLIHAAIEKNLQNSSLRADGDVNGCTSPLGSWQSRGETPINRMPSPQIHSSHQLHQHYHYQKQHNHPMDPPVDFPVPRHPPLPGPANNELPQQHLSMKIMSNDRPNSYSPSCFQTPLMNTHEAVPPPAHSHHLQQIKNAPYEKPSSRGPPTHYLENNRLYELAAVAAERGRLDEKEKRAHKENASRDLPYSASLLRLPCDPMSLHKGLNLKGGSGSLHQVGPSTAQLAGIHMGSGRGSITKGTSGRSEALQQQGSERHAPHDWPAPARTSGYSLGGLPVHPSAMDYPSPAQVLRGDFLTAHQMGQPHFSPQSQPYHLQLQYYQGLARQGEKKHRQSPASHEVQLLNKNHLNQEPAKKKPRTVPEVVTQNIYQDQADYSLSHKKAVCPEDVPKHLSVESRTHSRNPQLANYYYPLEAQHYMNDGQRPKSSHQQINVNVDKSQDQQKLGKKEFQPPNQMTAANLIEAIIYLQINRNETDETALKLPGSSLSNSSLLPHLATPRDDGIPPDRVTRMQLNSQHAAPVSKAYEKSHKFNQGPPQIGDYSSRGTSDSRVMPERMGPMKDDEAAHNNKHVKENNPSKKFTPYDHLNQPQYLRHEPHAINPRPTSGGKKFITASDRIEAIIAQDIGNQEDMPTHNEDVQSAIKEYMRMSDNRPTKFDAIESSLLSRFPYAKVRPYDFDKSYLPFYAPGMIRGLVPLRMPVGQVLPEDKPATSQRILSPKVWQHGVAQVQSERNAADSWSPQKHMSYSIMEAKQGAVQPASKEHRSENDTMPVKHSPSQQFHHPPKLTSADLRNSMHISPNTPSKPSGTNSSERASCKDTNCSDNYGSSTASSENSPHVSSHMTWKAKMLRQHKEQKIAENSLGQHQLSSENISQSGSRSSKEDAIERVEGGRMIERSLREENKPEAGQEHRDVALRSSSTSSMTPPASGQPSPMAKPLTPHDNSADTRSDSSSHPVSNYWSPRLSTEKCSSSSSDGLRIDLPIDDEDKRNTEDKHD